MPNCPAEDDVLCFVEGRLEAARVATLEAHARECPTCEQLLAAAMVTSSSARTPGRHGGRAPRIPLGDLPHGVLVGRYTVLSLLGRGGMGEVYAAYDPQLDRRVALKLLSPRYGHDNLRAEARLLREARAIARLSHPNVIAVYDVGRVGDRIFVAMELVDGQTLASWLAAEPRSQADILQVFLGAARGLAAAHASGLVHRDFKPQNVMVARDGTARVTDFGLVQRLAADGDSDDGAAAPEADDRVLDLTLTCSGELIGTPLYMSPEQFKLEPTDARTDQFSFCVALYQALVGVHPFRTDAGAGVARLKADVVAGKLRQMPARAEVPAWIRGALVRGLATAPEARWRSMADLAAELERRIAPAVRRYPAVGTRERMLVGGVMAVLGVVAVVVLDLLRHSTRTAVTTRLLVTPAIALSLHALAAWIWRRRLLANEFTRKAVAMAWFGGITVMLHRLMAFRFGEPVPYVLAVDLVVLGVEQVIAAMLLDRCFGIVALPFFAGAGLAMLAPAQAVHSMLGAVTTAYAIVAVCAAADHRKASRG